MFLLPIYGDNNRNQQWPDNLKRLDKAIYYRLTGNSASLHTIELINENAAEVLADLSLGHIPILVLSFDSGNLNSVYVTKDTACQCLCIVTIR